MSKNRAYSSILDTSWKLPPSSIVSLSSSKFTQTPIPYDQMASGSVISSTIIRNNTRASVPNSNVYTLFSGSFTKLKSDSKIIAECTVFGANFNSGNCGVGMNIDGGNWDFGTAYQYDGLWTRSYQTTVVFGLAAWTSISVGSHTVGFGWKTINGSATDAPFTIFNPNNTDDPRNQQMVSTIHVYEVNP